MAAFESAENNRRFARNGRAAALLFGLVALAVAPIEAWANCKPKKPRPQIVLQSMGPCAFDPERLSYTGEPAQQAACLLRPVAKLGKLGAVLDALPDVLAERVGQAAHLPPREALSAYLSAQGLVFDFAAFLWQPIARARDNDPDAPAARYFVIHDTSGPFLGVTPFPADIDTHRKINNLAGHRCEDGWESAHVIINRSGNMLLGHDLAIPWRATKFERAVNFDGALKGLYLHVELIQPRRSEWRTVRSGRKGRRVRRVRGRDSLAPEPGFSAAQYDRLALVYTIASVRADRWLIPAFHATIDGHIYGGHDDPQNFVLGDFASSLERLLAGLREPTRTAEADSGPLIANVTQQSGSPDVLKHPEEDVMNRQQRDEATEANQAMNAEFGKDRGDPTPRRPNQRPDQDAGQQNAEEIKEEAVKQANDSARVRKPFP